MEEQLLQQIKYYLLGKITKEELLRLFCIKEDYYYNTSILTMGML